MTLTPAQVDAIREAFEAIDSFNLNENYACHEVWDLPTSYARATKTKTIVHDLGCQSPSKAAALTALEFRIDQVVGSTRWLPRR